MNALKLLGLLVLAAPLMAQDVFTLSSPALVDGAALPVDLKCARDGGDGLSPPIEWRNAPEGTAGFAIIMHHYPRGRIEGKDAPSQYWLLWNIPAETTSIARGNPLSIGDEGADKDMRRTGYTPPCSPAGSLHEYTITAYALSATLALPDHDDGMVNWDKMTSAMDGLVLGEASLRFVN